MPVSPVSMLPFMGWNYRLVTNQVSDYSTIMPADPRRAGIVFSIGNNGAMSPDYQWRVAPQLAAGPELGFLINSSSPTLVLDFQQFGPLLGEQWSSWFGTVSPLPYASLHVYWWYFDPATIKDA